MTHVYFSGQAASDPLATAEGDSVTDGGIPLAYETDLFDADLLSSFSDSFLSCGAAEVGVESGPLPKSKAVPGVFGVLAVEPNDANAPDPSPNAEDPPTLGEATVLALRGVLALNGLFLFDDMLPNRFDADPWLSLLSCRSALSVERESFAVLESLSQYRIKPKICVG